MPDTYSINLTHTTSDRAKAWEGTRIVTTTIEHVSPGGRKLKTTPPWELMFDDRRWYRDSLKELEVLAAGMELESFVIFWNYVVEGLQWSVTVNFWPDGKTTIGVTAYAGTERMATEEAVRLVVKHARDRGVEFFQGPTKIRSTELSTAGDSKRLVINSKPMKKWAMFRAWVGPHMASYVVGVLASVTAAALLVVLRLSG